VLRLTPEGEYDAERRIRAVLAETPRATIKAISEQAQVSSATASKWARVIREEQRTQQQQQQQHAQAQ
jgi:transposase